jgi:hypothetical protein
MYKIELTAMQLIKIVNILEGVAAEHIKASKKAKKNKDEFNAELNFYQAQTYKKMIASIEAQIKGD